jgi:hypothetical protein
MAEHVMIFKIGVFIIGVLLFNWIVIYLFKKICFLKTGNMERYKLKKIEKMVNKINNPKLYFGYNIDDKELMQMLIEYSMETNNYRSALKNINKIEKLSESKDVKEVAEKAIEVLKERFLNESV